MGQIVPFASAAALRQTLCPAGGRLVFTNGCFDILHAGHVRYLQGARKLGDALVVGLNGDDSVKALKGPGRPINPEEDRAEVLAALGCVDAVVIFPEMRATHLIESLRPDVYVKGGDYSAESINPEEAEALRASGTELQFLPLVPGRSTTQTLARATQG